MANAATQFITRTYSQPYRPASLSGIAKRETPAVRATSDPYTDFIWALAQKFTNSYEEAEAAVVEMQTDIAQCAERGLIVQTNEDRLVARIAWRRLIKFLQ
ncbi:hypothetical protein BH10ACI3_BH10ACI3_18100 [soil metagenome]